MYHKTSIATTVVIITNGNYYKIHRILTPDGKAYEIPEIGNAESTPAGGVTENSSLATPINSAFNNSISEASENSNTDFDGPKLRSNYPGLTEYDRYLEARSAESQYSEEAVSERENLYNGKSLYRNPEVYDYAFMVALPDMVVQSLPPLSSVKTDNRVDQGKAIRLGLENAASVGRAVAKDMFAIRNEYTDREIVLGKNGLEHGLGGEDVGRLRTNARLASIGGLVVKYAVPVNGLKNTNRQAKGTYAMACLLSSGDRDVVAIITVEEHTSKAIDIDYVDITQFTAGALWFRRITASIPRSSWPDMRSCTRS